MRAELGDAQPAASGNLHCVLALRWAVVNGNPTCASTRHALSSLETRHA
jgi:hypothetical protein